MNGQLDLFGGAVVPVGAVRPRPADPDRTCGPEYVQVEPDVWTVVVYTLIPKNGWQHLDFPHYWGGPAESPRWRVARHGELPGETFLFDSREHARNVVAEVFGAGTTDLHPHMTWISVPSDDHRQYAGRRAPRRQPTP